jgi:hypothetical protein
MTDDVKIDLQDNSPHRVALELAYAIAKAEREERGREYWLNLYAQCRSVVLDGMSAADAMEGGN